MKKVSFKNQVGGAREGAGRKKNTVEKKVRNLSFTNEDWEFIKQSSGSERKVADFIVKAVRGYMRGS